MASASYVSKPIRSLRPVHATFVPSTLALNRLLQASSHTSIPTSLSQPSRSTTTCASDPLPRAATLILSLAIAATTVSPMQALAHGVGNSLLDNCQPARLTCVSSQDDTPTSFLEPWEYDESLDSLRERMVTAVLNEPRATLVVKQPRYLLFEIPTTKPDVVDDLEFFFPPLDNVVHFRSARRDRSFDFWLNRRRLDRLRLKIGLAQITVLRNRVSALSIFESPFDSFGPSAVDVDALIENRGLGSRSMR